MDGLDTVCFANCVHAGIELYEEEICALTLIIYMCVASLTKKFSGLRCISCNCNVPGLNSGLDTLLHVISLALFACRSSL